MSNYYTMFRYAKSFAGEFNALDIVHSLWLRYFNKTGEDILQLKTSNRWLYKCIRNEYFNQYNKYNRYEEIDLENYIHYNNVTLSLEAEERDAQFKKDIYDLVQKEKDKAHKNMFGQFELYILIKIYRLLSLGYKVKEIAEEIGISQALTSYYKKKIINHLKINMANAWRNPFNGSKLQVTRRVSLKTWEGRMKEEQKEFEEEDFNEYYRLLRHIESGEGLLVRLPEEKTNPYLK